MRFRKKQHKLKLEKTCDIGLSVNVAYDHTKSQCRTQNVVYEELNTCSDKNYTVSKTVTK